MHLPTSMADIASTQLPLRCHPNTGLTKIHRHSPEKRSMNSPSERRPLLLATLMGSAMSAAGCMTLTHTDAAELITEKSRQWTASYSSGDAAAMEQILADDFIGTSPSGRRYGRREAIESAKKGQDEFAATVLDKIEVRIFDGMALALGEDLLTVKSGDAVLIRTRWTDTWVLRQGIWRAVASHESVVKDSRA
jgi:ketosteroid isomerase-like protein